MGLNLVIAAVVLQIVGTIIISRMVKIEYRADGSRQPVDVRRDLPVDRGGHRGYVLVLQRSAVRTAPPAADDAGRRAVLSRADVARRTAVSPPRRRRARSCRSRRRKWAASSTMLAGAGYYSSWAATMYALAQMILPLAIIAFAVTRFGTGSTTLIFGALAAALGYYAPDLWLARAIERRKKEISNGLPDASTSSSSASNRGPASIRPSAGWPRN